MMPDPSQPKRSVPWAAVAVVLLLAAYVGCYVYGSKRQSYPGYDAITVYREFQSKVAARLCVPAAWVEAKLRNRRVVLQHSDEYVFDSAR